MTLDLSQGYKEVEKKPKSMTFKELEEAKKGLQALRVTTAQLDTEYQRKIAWSFSALFFIMLGLPIAVITHRREKSANLVLAVICAAGYYLLSLGCEALSVQGLASPGFIMWVPNVLAGGFAAILNYKLCTS